MPQAPGSAELEQAKLDLEEAEVNLAGTTLVIAHQRNSHVH